MKFFTALLATETNTFVSIPTGWGAFNDYGIYHGDASVRDPHGYGIFAAKLRQMLAAQGHELVESLLAFAQPQGATVRSVYESLRDEVLEDLRKAGPVDGVILLLHGAMVADGYYDCEGDLIERVRAIVGPDVPIGVELDLHCHFTRKMREHTNIIVGYKEYPHTDSLDRMVELARIVIDTAEGRVKPTLAVHDCRMVGMWHTSREPMAGFVRRMIEAEQQPGVLSVTLGHGFAWADVPEAGAKLWVVTDNDPALAEEVALRLGKEFWELRHEIGAPVVTFDEALAQAREVEGGPVVFADVADNAGGGAASDSTFVLHDLIDNNISSAVMGGFWDPGAIILCRDAGVGATFDLRIGGKCGKASGDPVDVRVTVKAVVEDHTQTALEGNTRTAMGPCVWVQTAGGIDLVLISRRSQVFAPDLFTGLGIDLASKKIIVVKSAQHFYAGFAPIAKKVIYVSTPSGKSYDFARLPYRVRDLNYWPRLENPVFPHEVLGGKDAPGEFYRIDGHVMHLLRGGTEHAAPGVPTMVIEAGGGSGHTLYLRLHEALATKYPVVSYDRLGYGWSGELSETLDGEQTAKRLHALLEAAGIPGPYVFLGHSLGGLLSRIYTDLYPDEVAGVLLLDSSHHDQFDDPMQITPEILQSEREKRVKFQTHGEEPVDLAGVKALFADMPHVLKQMAATYLPHTVDSMVHESNGLQGVGAQAAKTAGLGDRPLAVLWAPPHKEGPEKVLQMSARWPGYQQDLSTLSTRSRIELVEGSSHIALVMLPPFVQRILEVVDDVVEQAGGAE